MATGIYPVQIIGEFTNMESTREHAYGYTVQLSRQSDRVFGLLEASEGLAGIQTLGTASDPTTV